MVAALFIDLDHFKNVNDTLGHTLGDELLRQFADRLIECVRSRDTVGRLGGDEFGLILLISDGQRGALRVAHKVLEVLQAPFLLDGREVVLGASVGSTVFVDDAADAGELIYADTAMHQAKQAGRGTFRFFTAQMNNEVLSRLELETALRKAVDNGEFVLHYQPKVWIGSGRVVGLEALLRWNRPGYGLVPPQEFITARLRTAIQRWRAGWRHHRSAGRQRRRRPIAEGVETAAQLEYLRRQGCDSIQGNFFSPAVPAPELELLLRADKRRPAADDAKRVPAKTLLLVDDDADVLAALQLLLRHEGYQILAARSAVAGFELLALYPVHVILCDQRMPGMSGTEFLDRVKDMYPDALRIALSGYADLESLMEAINRGALYRFSMKPWDNDVLLGNIRDAFHYCRVMHGLPAGGGR